MTFRVVRTNQYNQDLGLIHSTNGNHLESPNEGSSIDHQVDFASVLTTEHAGMVRLFKSMENTGLRGFLEGTTYVFENAVTEFFFQCKGHSWDYYQFYVYKLVVTEDIFSATFKLPTEGITVLADIQKATIVEMQHRFSATEVPFKISGKKREMHFEYRLLHDIVAKSLCAKAGSFDPVTCEKFEFMTAISAGISVNWDRIMFQRLLGMVQNSKKQSRGYTVPISILLTTLVQADLGESVKLHSKKKRKHKDGGNKKWTKKVTELEAQTAEKQTVEERRPVAPTHFDSGEVPELDSCPLVTRHCRRKQVSKSSDSESTISLPLKDFVKKRRNQRQRTQLGWTAANIASQPDPTPVSPTEQEGTADDQMLQGSGGDYFEKDLEFDARKEHEEQHDQEFTDDEREDSGHEAQMGDNDQIANPESSLIMNKLFELELEKLYQEHLAHFKLDVPSVNHDFECIRRLHKELRVTAAVHRNHRVMASLPIINPEQPPALEFSHLVDHEQGAEQTTSPQLDHPGHETPAMTSHEHQAQENEPAIQTDEHRTEGNEHQALAELVQGSNQTLEDRPAVFVPSDQNDSNHQGLSPTNLQLIASASADTSTLQLLDTAAQSLTALSTRVSSLDQAYARIRDDTNMTRHHTILMRDQLKNDVDGLDIKIDVLERTFTQRMVDELAVVKSHLAALVEGLREFGDAKKGEGGQNRPGKGQEAAGQAMYGEEG
ncbi:hypothetical protein F511_28359 [Dorcoceras hygrometricum]|uniref:Uncharacterized protein n=1 Tax=Dorcoceras hygrometricum TaxID=472368 RepID=A0A2Z7BAD5_9LAMI|nr:hypothetical protein F511_28359 [Dorcoceras hygrometricum]